MESTELSFVLTRPAKSAGGDRYEHGTKDDDDFMTLYVPQSISRRGGAEPAGFFSVVLTPKRG